MMEGWLIVVYSLSSHILVQCLDQHQGLQGQTLDQHHAQSADRISDKICRELK